jgi:hypothetical protein
MSAVCVSECMCRHSPQGVPTWHPGDHSPSCAQSRMSARRSGHLQMPGHPGEAVFVDEAARLVLAAAVCHCQLPSFGSFWQLLPDLATVHSVVLPPLLVQARGCSASQPTATASDHRGVIGRLWTTCCRDQDDDMDGEIIWKGF